MLEGLRQLLEIQALDDERLSYDEEGAAIPRRRSNLDEQCAEARRKLDAAKEALTQAESGLRAAEGELQDTQALRQKLEGQQLQVKDNEAYSALLREMENADRGISDLETRILEAMEAIDTAGSGCDSAERAERSAASRMESESLVLDAREGELADAIVKLRVQREELCGRIAPELLEQYEKIAARRRPAVVRVTEEICMGCRVRTPPQLNIELLRGEAVVLCGSCNRILIRDADLPDPAN